MLNLSQKEVVQHTEGPLMVIAGPGTGKTFTLVKKVIYLLTEKKISPESIFITTFTRKAVNELRLRIAEEIKSQNLKIDSNRIKISTFHSFCIELLEREKLNILDELEQRYFIYKNMYHFENVEGFNLLMSSLINNFQSRALAIQKQFNKLSEHNISSKDLIDSTNKLVAVLGLVYDKYLHLLKTSNLLDFSTIQSSTLNLLDKKPEIIEKLVDQFKYILVDEYQDTNTIQNQILFTLFSKIKNICVVGDDDQSIYRFRGATVRNILNFPHKFSHEKFKTIKLEVNFRSNSEIIDFYSNFMTRYNWENKRYKKELTSATNDINHPTVGKIIGVTSEQWETSLVNSIKDLKEKNIISDYSDIVFLAQSVKSLDILSLIKRMNENGIPTYSPRSGNFFKKEEIKIVLGIALSLYKEYTRKNIYNTLNYSNFETYTYYKDCVHLLKDGSNGKFKDMIPSLKEMNFNHDTKFLDILYKFFSFEYFKNIFSKSNLEDKAYEIMENNLSIFSNIIFKYEEQNGSIFKEDFFDSYLPFLKECGINEYENEREVSIKNHVSFLTFHQSKGLEFPIVLVGSLDKEPKKSFNDFDKILRKNVFNISTIQFEEEEQEDFYRVFYTAFSRAKNYLFLTCKDNREIQTKGKKNLTPSNFFSELIDSLLDYRDIFPLQDDYSTFLKVENSKDKFFKKKYSFTSDIALYLECPVKYRFLRYSNFPKTQTNKEYLGILVHNTVHNIHQRVLEKEIVTEAEVKTLLNSNYRQLRSKMNFTLDLDQKKTAYNSVINYLALESYSLMDIEKSEIDLSILRDNYVLNGVLDLIKKKGNEYSVIDFKTSSVKPESIPENYKKQLYIYGYLAESSGYPVNNLEIYYTSVEKDPKTSFIYEKTQLNLILKEADEVVDKIMNKDFFEPKISNSCNFCSFINYCNK